MLRIIGLLLTIVWPVEFPPAVDYPVTATEPAVRLDPSATIPDIPVNPPVMPAFSGASNNGRCVGAEPLLRWFSPGWDPIRMSRIMYRESRCQPGVRNGSGATGLLQIMPSNCPYIARQLGEACSAGRLTDPVFNIRSARELYEYDGYRPWAL